MIGLFEKIRSATDTDLKHVLSILFLKSCLTTKLNVCESSFYERFCKLSQDLELNTTLFFYQSHSFEWYKKDF